MFAVRFFDIIKSLITSAVAVAVLAGCGQLDQAGLGGTKTSASGAGRVEFRGYVLNAFEVTVDGATYQDLEAYYTHEVDRLPERLADAGYDSSWKATLDARLGFVDLFRGMTVYVAPADTRGYQAQSSVDGNGAFSVSMPQDALGSDYRVRANKRIALLLTRGKETLRFCYNFSATDHDVSFNDADLPIVLETFNSSITKYACPVEPRGTDSGLVIPGNPAKTQAGDTAPPAAATINIKVGDSKGLVLAAMGRAFLEQRSPVQWCWNVPLDVPNPVCDVHDTADCTCSIQFDGEGLVSRFVNIRADLIRSDRGAP
ncbi:hypothetical protein EBZ80_25490 [bacterium]|nr:hypothetical protein [bacterium]